jgi:hypothetical protein
MPFDIRRATKEEIDRINETSLKRTKPIYDPVRAAEDSKEFEKAELKVLEESKGERDCRDLEFWDLGMQ